MSSGTSTSSSPQIDAGLVRNTAKIGGVMISVATRFSA
jgi:hypothetical protein